MPVLDKIKSWIGRVVEIALMVTALAIVLQVLLGRHIQFFGDVIGNLVDLVGQLGENGLVGLVAIVIVLWLFSRRTPG